MTPNEHTEQSEREKLIRKLREGVQYDPESGKPRIGATESLMEEAAALLAADKPAESGGEAVAWCVYCDGQFTLNIFQVEAVARAEKARLDHLYPGSIREVVALYTKPQADKVGGYEKALEIRAAQGWKLTGKAVPVLYTDTINGEQVCRDDVWLCTTGALRQEEDKAGGEAAGWFKYDKVSQCWHPQYEEFAASHAEKEGWQQLFTHPQPQPSALPDDVVKGAILANLDGLSDDAAVHIYPDDLEKCSRAECAVTAYSVRVGDISGARSVPLFSREQVVAAIDAAMLKEGK